MNETLPRLTLARSSLHAEHCLPVGVSAMIRDTFEANSFAYSYAWHIQSQLLSLMSVQVLKYSSAF